MNEKFQHEAAECGIQNFEFTVSERVQVKYFVFSLLRNGSVIASFNVSYSSIDSLQIVMLQEELAGGMLGNSSTELLDVSSNYGKSNKLILIFNSLSYN